MTEVLVTIALWTLNVLVIGLCYIQRRTLIFWRMSLRRELIFVEGYKELSQELRDGGREDMATAFGMMSVQLADEIHNQSRHEGWWPKAPRPGKPWPDFEPADLARKESWTPPSS